MPQSQEKPKEITPKATTIKEELEIIKKRKRIKIGAHIGIDQ